MAEEYTREQIERQAELFRERIVRNLTRESKQIENYASEKSSPYTPSLVEVSGLWNPFREYCLDRNCAIEIGVEHQKSDEIVNASLDRLRDMYPRWEGVTLETGLPEEMYERYEDDIKEAKKAS